MEDVADAEATREDGRSVAGPIRSLSDETEQASDGDIDLR